MHNFASRAAADQAVLALSQAGFDMRKLSLLAKGHHADIHTLRERSTAEHVRSWVGVGMVWGALFGLLAPASASGLADSHGYLVATLIHTVGGAAGLGGLAAVVGALNRPGRHGGDVRIDIQGQAKADAQGGADGHSKGDSATHEHDAYRLVIRGSADDHAQARQVIEHTRSAARQTDTTGTAGPCASEGTGSGGTGSAATGIAAAQVTGNTARQAAARFERNEQPASGASVHPLHSLARPAARQPVDDGAPGDAALRQHTRRERLSA